MASTPVKFKCPAAMTLTLELYPLGTDTIANGAGGDAATEATNNKGTYTATVTEAITGWHDARAKDGSGNTIGVGWVNLHDTTDVHWVHTSPPELFDQLDDSEAKTTLIGSGTFTVTQPVDPDTGDLRLIQGDDHASENRLLRWEFAEWSGPDMTGASVELRLTTAVAYQQSNDPAAELIVTGGTVTMDGTTLVVEVPLTSDESDGLTGSFNPDQVTHTYQLIVPDAGSGDDEDTTLAIGDAYVRRRVAPAP